MRLERHGLLSPHLDATPGDVVARICGAHAQIMGAAELSIALRLADATREDVRRAVRDDHTLVKTFGPRGTVHLLPTHELPMWTGALSAVPMGQDGLPPELRLTPDQTDQCIEAIDHALRDAELTTDELGERVIAATGRWAAEAVIPAFDGRWPRWRRALIPAARRGVLCFGVDRGRNVTYTSPTRWLPGFAMADPGTALATLVARYLDAFGPATPAHVAQWLAAPRGWASRLFERLAPDLVEVEMEGERGWLTPTGAAARRSHPEGVRLLPYFEAYAVGSHPRAWVFVGAASQRALARGQAGNVPVVLADGVVAGIWHQRRVGQKLQLRVELFDPLDRHQLRELSAQAERVGRIVDLDVVLTLGPVEAGRHL